MASKKTRRISKKRIATYLSKVTAKLSQEDKLVVKITEVTNEIEKLKSIGSSALVIKIHENKLRMLNSQLLSVQNRRMQAERKFENSVKRNDSLNGESSAPLQ